VVGTAQAATPSSHINYDHAVASAPNVNTAQFRKSLATAASAAPSKSLTQNRDRDSNDVFAITAASPKPPKHSMEDTPSHAIVRSSPLDSNASGTSQDNVPFVARKNVAPTVSEMDWSTLPNRGQTQNRDNRFISPAQGDRSQQPSSLQQVAHRTNTLRPSEPEVITAANWTNRNQAEEPAGRSVLQRTQPENLFDQPSTIQPTPSVQAPSSEATPSKIPPNPFPPMLDKQEPELLPTEPPSLRGDNSPSDLDNPPPGLRPGNREPGDLLPPRPTPSKKNLANCDEVRDRASSSSISSIDLDVAPNFGVGPKEKLTPEDKRRNFAQSAAIRAWRDQDGNVIAEGKLIDHTNHLVIIENATGTRQSIELRSLSDADAVYVSESWGLPVTCSLGNQPTQPRVFEGTTVAWKASGLCHKPLYFEEIQLERSGHEYGPIVQPAISTVHFFKNIAFLPYKMGIHPMNECQYALGHYRPGNCAPWSIEPIPLSLRGAAAQAKAITGTALMFP
jgi:hypothetical protein